MSDTATIEAPPSQSESTGGGIAEFTNQLAATVAKEMAEPAAAEPSPESTATPEAKSEAKPEVTAEKTAETVNKEPAQDKAPRKIAEMTMDELEAAAKKQPSKYYKLYEHYKEVVKREIGKESESLREKIKTLESRPQSEANDKKIETYEKQLKELGEQLLGKDKTIADLDYTKSEEFQRNYVSKYNRIQTAALEEFKRLTLTEGETQRPATEADFKRLMKRDIGEQFELVKQWLGDTASAQRLLTNLNRMEEIHAEAADAREQARQNAEQSRTKAELQTKEEARLYETQLEVEHNDLVEKFPELFGDTDNQEAATAMEQGRAFAKRALADRAKMSPAERASHDAVLIETHAALRRMTIERKADAAEIETLKKELAKFRKSDPGNAGAGSKTPAVADADDIGGIEQMSAMYKKQ